MHWPVAVLEQSVVVHHRSLLHTKPRAPRYQRCGAAGSDEARQKHRSTVHCSWSRLETKETGTSLLYCKQTVAKQATLADKQDCDAPPVVHVPRPGGKITVILIDRVLRLQYCVCWKAPQRCCAQHAARFNNHLLLLLCTVATGAQSG